MPHPPDQAARYHHHPRGWPALRARARGWLARLGLSGSTLDTILAGFAVALAMLVAIAIASARNIVRFEEGARWIEHTHQVIFLLEQSAAQVTIAEASIRGYLLTGQVTQLDPYHTALAELPDTLRTLVALSQDNPVQRDNVSLLQVLINARLARFEEILRLNAQPDSAALVRAYVMSGNGYRLMQRVRDQIRTMQQIEQNLLAQRSEIFATEATNLRSFLIIGNVTAFLLLGSAFWLLRREVMRRRASDAELTTANVNLQHQTERLIAANEELESFSYSISHDLRIPLRAVDGYAAMIEEDYAERLDDEGRRMLAVVRDNSSRMGALIDDLLAFSRFGRSALTPGLIDMNALVAHVVETLRDERDATGADLQIGPLPAAWADPGLISQVWTNLLANALKYSAHSRPPRITVSGEVAGEMASYAVRDNGVGFDMRHAGKLFGVFQRLHGQAEFPGTGVGLAIVQRIVVRHGGRVWAEARPQAGATFHFTLPTSATP